MDAILLFWPLMTEANAVCMAVKVGKKIAPMLWCLLNVYGDQTVNLYTVRVVDSVFQQWQQQCVGETILRLMKNGLCEQHFNINHIMWDDKILTFTFLWKL